jgi:hypothetical protein
MMVLGCDPHKRSITCGAVEAATGVARGVRTAAVSQAGFDGDLEAGMICPGGSRGSIDAPPEEVPA